MIGPMPRMKTIESFRRVLGGFVGLREIFLLTSSGQRRNSRKEDDCIRTAGAESGVGEGRFGRSDTML